jgi:lipid II:glycine glycyltransferase (peptidoglycan interpeptide bridge formation enzyme)
MTRVNTKKNYFFSSEYFEKMMKSDSFESYLLLAKNKESGETVAASEFIITNNTVQYHLSGTKNDVLHLMPTKLLIDEMPLIASRKGLTYFNLGGGIGGKNDDSLFKFKSSFSKDFNLWKFVVNKEIYYQLISQKGINQDSDFFPQYRCSNNINL